MSVMVAGGSGAGADMFGENRVQGRLLHPVIAWLLVGAVFVVGYGLPVTSSVMSILGWTGDGAGPTSTDADRRAWLGVLLVWQFVLGGAAVGALVPVWWQHRRRRGVRLPFAAVVAPPGKITWILVPVVVAIVAVSFALGHALADDGLVGVYSPRASTLDGSLSLSIWATVMSMVAGPMEEIGVLLVPVLLLRASGHRWAVVYIACIVMRLSFHLDYGLPIAAGLAIWAALMVTLYRTTRQLVSLVIGHGLYNCLVHLTGVFDAHVDGAAGDALSSVTTAVWWGVIATGITIMVVAAGRALRRGARSVDQWDSA